MIKKTDIGKKNVATKQIAMNSVKTPAKKSFPAKMREQVNSCKKPESKKILAVNMEFEAKKHKHISKDRFLNKEIDVKATIPSSYYQSEYNGPPDIVYVANSQLKKDQNKAQSLVSPHKVSGKSSTVGRKSRHGLRNKVQMPDNPQMGGSKYAPAGISSSQKRMESGGYNRAHLRNMGMGVIASRGSVIETTDREFDMQQVPVKIFDMHGIVRAPMRVEEMQGATIYKTEMDYHGNMAHSAVRNSSKRLQSRDKVNRKSRGQLPASMEVNSPGYRINNQMYTQSLPLNNSPETFGQK